MYFALLLALLLSSVVSAGPIEPTGRWNGMIDDLTLREKAPKSGVLTSAAPFRELWQAWRGDEAIPEVDFAKNLVLVATVEGPNLVIMNPDLQADGDLRYMAAGTRRAGPGFGYLLLQIPREGVLSVNGQDLPGEADTAVGEADGDDAPATATDEEIIVRVVGRLKTGVMAIGGESTGTTITSRGVTWELELGNDEARQQLARSLDGQLVRVRGSLRRVDGVERGPRWIVAVERLKKASN